MKIIEYSIKNRIVIVFATLILTVAGIFAYFKLGKLEDPEFKVKEAIIVTLYPGASPENVEQEVTDKIEIALRKIPNADVDSVSKAEVRDLGLPLGVSPLSRHQCLQPAIRGEHARHPVPLLSRPAPLPGGERLARSAQHIPVTAIR